MKNLSSSVPHFLRVVRAIARVKGAALPVMVVTTVVAGLHCSEHGIACTGSCVMPGSGGSVGSTTGTGALSGATGVAVSSGGGMGGLGGSLTGVAVSSGGASAAGGGGGAGGVGAGSGGAGGMTPDAG